MIVCAHEGADCRDQNPHIPAQRIPRRVIELPHGDQHIIEEQVIPGHRHCEWCRYCTDCHPHTCEHDGEPCSRCGTSIKDRPLPRLGDHVGMCQPPEQANGA